MTLFKFYSRVLLLQLTQRARPNPKKQIYCSLFDCSSKVLDRLILAEITATHPFVNFQQQIMLRAMKGVQNEQICCFINVTLINVIYETNADQCSTKSFSDLEGQIDIQCITSVRQRRLSNMHLQQETSGRK
jgi:hypothetical protein